MKAAPYSDPVAPPTVERIVVPTTVSNDPISVLFELFKLGAYLQESPFQVDAVVAVARD